MRKFSLSILFAIAFYSVSAQIRINPTDVNEWIKHSFGGQGIVLGNVKYGGNPASIAAFTNSTKAVQFKKGLVLSTGKVADIVGLNSKPDQTSFFGDLQHPEQDSDLSGTVTGKLYDICYIEFDFVPTDNNIQFNYQFGSEEYPEFVGSSYNDIFAFFVSDGETTKNIAMVPGKTNPVNINNINAKTDSVYFIDNNVFLKVPAGQNKEKESDFIQVKFDPDLLKKVDQELYRNLQYDGITKKLIATTYVQPYKKYHMKIIISDVGDNMYDSGVFIEEHSFIAKRDTTQVGYVPYRDLEGEIDLKLILSGKKLEEILPPVSTLVEPQGATLPEISVKNEIVYFDFGKAEIIEKERLKLKAVADLYKQVRDNYCVQLIGHTDGVGSLRQNMELSKRRNQAVIDAMKMLLEEPLDVSTLEKAFLQPVADNNTDEGRRANRRVEILFKRRD